MVPMSTKAVSGESRRRKRVMRPMDSTPTTGQKRSSKRKNTLRDAMTRLRKAKAQMATSSARQLNEHLLQLRLAHLHVADHDPLRVQLAEDLGQSLLSRVDGGLDPSPAPLRHAQRPLDVGEERARGGGIELEGDDVA